MLKLINYLKDKDIALIGNAKSILKKRKNIDKHEVIIRMNKGFPKGKEKYVGSRTDILALSLGLKKDIILKEYNPKHILWCTPKYSLRTKYIEEKSFTYSYMDWARLAEILDTRPSTGCMAFDFLIWKVAFKTLTLYGFDFWKSPNWYTNKVHLGQHNPYMEEAYVRYFAKYEGIYLK